MSPAEGRRERERDPLLIANLSVEIVKNLIIGWSEESIFW